MPVSPSAVLPRPLPPGFRYSWLESDQGRLRLVWGGRGRPVLMIPGLGGSAEDFFDCARALASHYLLIIPDMPGFGLSAKPDAPYSLDWFLDVLTGLARRLGLERARWVGHSLGGLMVLALAARHPGLVERVAAICPAGGQRNQKWEARLLGPPLIRRDDRLLLWSPVIIKVFLKYVFSVKDHPAAFELQRRVLAQWSGPDRRLRERAFIRSARTAIGEQVWRRVGAIQAPVFLVVGDRDRVIPARHTRRIWHHLPPGASLLNLPCGHMAPYVEAPALARALAQFLE